MSVYGYIRVSSPQMIEDMGGLTLQAQRQLIFATTLCLGLAFASHAAASDDFKADLRHCEEMADLRASSTGHSSATNAAIGGVANVLGAVIGDYNAGPAVSGAVQQGIRGMANDAQNAEWRRQAMIDQCLRERTMR